MAEYVGKLYQIETPDGVLPVEPVFIGVDDELGLVSAPSRSDITHGNFYANLNDPEKKPCLRLWYYRTRKGYAGDNWYHDLDPGATVQIDHTTAPPFVWFHAPDVEICNMTGAFLCG